jgi:hypothetical protein
VLSLAGCFSLEREVRSQRIVVTSEPAGARVSAREGPGFRILGAAPVQVDRPYAVTVKRFRHANWLWLLPGIAGTAAGGYFAGQGDSEAAVSAGAFAGLSAVGLIIALVIDIVGEVKSGQVVGSVPTPLELWAQLPGYQAHQVVSLPAPGDRVHLALAPPPMPAHPVAHPTPAPAPVPGPPLPAPPPGPIKRVKKGTIIAVFDVEDAAGRLKDKDLGQLTEYLATKLTEAGFRVVPRNQLRARLVEEKKEGFKKCYDETCQLELGKAVAAQKSLATKLLQVGESCAVSATLYDLKTETTERAASARTNCSVNALMDGMEKIAGQLGGK